MFLTIAVEPWDEKNNAQEDDSVVHVHASSTAAFIIIEAYSVMAPCVAYPMAQ